MSVTAKKQSLVVSYLFMRKAVGIIGMALPIVLVIGKMLLESPGISDSMSAYYYSVMRNVFVGSLWALAIFLISYRYEPLDDILSSIAGLCAVGVAVFPTTPIVGNATAQQVTIGWLHLSFAVSFFSLLAFFALVLFRKTDSHKKLTHKKQQRNTVYMLCGIAIVACLVLLALYNILPGASSLRPLHPTFWLEAVAVTAFGIAWFVKGETILKDK